MKQIQTGNIIPFSNDALNEYAPIVVKIKSVKSEADKKYIEESPHLIAQTREIFEQYKKNQITRIQRNLNENEEQEINIKAPNFEKVIYHIQHLGTGEIVRHVFCKEGTLRDEISYQNKQKAIRIYFDKKNNNKNSKIKFKEEKSTTMVIDGILVFRFFVFRSNYFFEGQPKGFYEVFRICFKEKEVWGENREGIYNFNINYVQHFKKLHTYVKYEEVDKTSLSKNIEKVYPFLFHENGYKVENFPSFYNFCVKFNREYKQNKIYKNTPINIKNDLKKKHKIPKSIEEIPYNESENTDLYKARTICKEDFILFVIYKNKIEVERLYYTKNKLYTFGFNKFDNCWGSIRNKHIYGNNVKEKDIVYDKKFTQDALNQTILHKCKYVHCGRPIDICRFQLEYLFVEQALKNGFEHIAMDFVKYTVDSCYFLHKIIKFEKLIELKNVSLPELVGITNKQLKILNKDLTFKQLVEFNKIIKSKKIKNDFQDVILRIKVAQLCLKTNKTKINKIINLFKEKNKDYVLFFSNILKKEFPERLINRYIDYLGFIEVANRYGAFKYKEIIAPSDIDFLHDKAYRDYLYEKAKAGTRNNLSLEAKIANFVESEEYLQFLHNNDKYSICPVKKGIDLINEGKELSHCVGTYRRKVANQKSYIYFLRENQDIEKPYCTLEIKKYNKVEKIKDKKITTKVYFLNQCYGFNDSYIESKDCKKFINDWCKKNRIEIKCTV